MKVNEVVDNKFFLSKDELLTPLGRICSEIIDGALILGIYIILLVIFCCYQIPYLGSAFVICTIPPSDFEYIGQIELNYSGFLIVLYCLINGFYFIVNEYSGTTIGKRMVDTTAILVSHRLLKVSFLKVLTRQLIFWLICLMTWGVSVFLDYPYYVAIIANILIIHLSTFCSAYHRSLLDYLTGTLYILRGKKNIEICSYSISDVKSAIQDNILVNDNCKTMKACGQMDEKNVDGKTFAKNKKEKMLFLKNKYYFPFNKGVSRLLFVLWIFVSLYVELVNWRIDYCYDKYYLENAGRGFVALIVLGCFYLAFIWVYNGFKESKRVD